MSNKLPCELISWGRVVSLVHKLAIQIRQDDYHPDIIIAIGRGGYVPARLLADYLDRMNLTSIKVEHYFAGSHKQPVTTVIYPLSINVTDQRVLLVDDVSDSGETFNVTLQHIWQRSTPKEIKTAVLHHKIVSVFTPDYFAAKIINWRWLIYPWAQVEDVSSFIADMQPRPETLPDIGAQLMASYGIRVPDKLLKYILEEQ